MATDAPIPAQRRYIQNAPEKEKKKQVAPHNEQAYRLPEPFEENWDTLYDMSPDWLKPVVGGAASFQRFSDQLQKNVVSGVMQIPTDVAGMVDLIRVGAPAIVTSIPDPGDGSDYFGRVGKAFTDGIFDENAQLAMQEHVQTKAHKFLEQKPDATPEQLDAFLDQYQNTQEFFDFMTSQMPPGFRLAQYGNDFANKFVQLGKRPDQQTIIDDLGQVFGQSIVGLPSSVMKAVGNQMRRAVGDAVMDSTTGKLALRATELLTPMTLPLSPGNVLANVAVGSALTEGVRTVTDQPSFLNGDIAEFALELDPPDGHGVDVGGQIDQGVMAAGVTLGSFFAFPAIRRKAADAANEKVAQAVRDLGTSAGPTMKDQSDALDPLLSPATGAANINAPVLKGANQFEALPETLDYLDAQQSAASHLNAYESVVRAANYGILDGMPHETIPLTHIQRAARQLSPDDYELLNQYFYARARHRSGDALHKSLTQQIADTRIDYSNALARANTREANALLQKLRDLETQLERYNADDPTMRPSMEEWSRDDVRRILDAGEQNDAVQQVARGMDKLYQDLVQYKFRNGRISSEQALVESTSGTIPLRERNRADVENPVKRSALLLKDRVLGAKKDLSYDASDPNLRVNRPKDALTTLNELLHEAVRDVTANNARRNIIDVLRKLPGAEGKMLRAFEFDLGNGRKSKAISPKQFEAIGRKQIGNRAEHFLRVSRDGMLEYWEFSDESMTKALQFAPSAAVPIANITRKIWQAGTTGLAAPWFAVKTALWDVPIARTTSRDGRSLGFLDTYARRLFNESTAINRIMDHVPISGAWASVAAAIPYQMAMRAARVIGRKIGDDLSRQAGIFNEIAKMPGGQEWLTFVGESMVKAFDRSAFNVYSRNLSTSLSHLGDGLEILNDYTPRGRGTALGAGFRHTLNMYKAAIESIQNSTRMAFFAENYGRLQAKYKGKVPKSEIDKLVQETRNLTGDMSRTSGNKTVQQATSVIPYGNAVIQGTRHMLGAMVPAPAARAVNKLTGGKANMLENRTNKFFSQFVGGMVLPSLGIMAVIDQWEGAQDWWYNKTPEWKRSTVLPIPTYEALEHLWEHGEWPEFDAEKHMHELPIAPEFAVLTIPIMAGLRAMGVVGPTTSHLPQSSAVDGLKSAFTELTSFATPPLINVLAAASGGSIDLRNMLLGPLGLGEGAAMEERRNLTFGGAGADNMTWNSGISQQLFEVVGALTAQAGQIAMQTWNVADIAMRDGSDFLEAAEKAFETGSYEVARRFPRVPGLPGLHRNYAFTPDSEYVYDTERTLEPLIGSGRQRTVELDSKKRRDSIVSQGMIPPERISEPLLKRMQEEVYSTLRKKGTYKQASDHYTELRVELNALEASRAKWPEKAYHAKRNEIVEKQQTLKTIQSQVMTNMLNGLNQKYGPAFEKLTGSPLTYESLVEAVKRNVQQ